MVIIKRFSQTIFLVILIGVFFVSCNKQVQKTHVTNKSTEKYCVSTKENDPFVIKLYMEKRTYKTNEKIKIWATLEYVGKKDDIKVWGVDPLVGFTISDGKEFKTGGLAFTISREYIFEKGKIYTYNYQKSGGYAPEEPNYEFWKKFYSEKDLYLPEGKYTVGVGFGGSLERAAKKNDYSISTQYSIEVVK